MVNVRGVVINVLTAIMFYRIESEKHISPAMEHLTFHSAAGSSLTMVCDFSCLCAHTHYIAAVAVSGAVLLPRQMWCLWWNALLIVLPLEDNCH